MTSDINLGQQVGGGQTLPPVGGDTTTTQTQTTYTAFEEPDTIEGTLSGMTPASILSYTAPTSIPKLPLPNLNGIDQAWTPPTTLPPENDPNFALLAAAFIPSGGTPKDGVNALKGFLSEYPPESPEYQTMLAVLYPKEEDAANMPGYVAIVRSLIDRAAEFSALGSTLTSQTGARSKTSLPEDITTNGQEEGLEVFPFARGPTAAGAAAVSSLTGETFSIPDMASLGIEGSPYGILVSGPRTAQAGTVASRNDLGDKAGEIATWVASAEASVAKFPESPEKTGMLNFLRAISKALTAFTELLYALQTADSSKIREATSAKLETALDQIEEQRKAIQKQLSAAHKEDKKGKMGVMGKILQGAAIAGLLLGACIAFFCNPIGPFVACLLLTQAADMTMKLAGQKGIWEHVFQEVDKVVEIACKAMGISDKAVSGLQIATKVVIACAIIAPICCSTGIFLGGAEVIKSMVNDSDIIKDKKAQMVIGMVIDVTVALAQIVVCIALMCPPFTAIGTAGLFAELGTFSKIGVTAAQLMALSATLIMGCMSMVESTNQILVSKIRMDLNKSLGNIEEDIVLKKMLIDLLKKLIKSLQESMQGFADAVKLTQTSLASMWSNLNNQLDQLNSSLLSA